MEYPFAKQMRNPKAQSTKDGDVKQAVMMTLKQSEDRPGKGPQNQGSLKLDHCPQVMIDPCLIGQCAKSSKNEKCCQIAAQSAQQQAGGAKDLIIAKAENGMA